jgi:protein phosphatase
MGTTMSAAVVASGSSLLIGHVGDSRAYLLRDGALSRVTRDHSLVEELVREGRLTPEQAESPPQRAIITRALGSDDEVDVDLYPIDVQPGDRIILCSDGLTTMLREREIERIALAERDPQHAADRLVDAANEAGGEDNITVVVLDVAGVDETGDDRAAAPVAAEPAAADEPTGRIEEPPVATRAAPVQSKRRRVTSIAFVVVPLLFIAAVALGAIAWYDRHNWFLAAEGGEVVLYRGRPDAVLWNATRESSPDVALGDLTSQGRSGVEDKSAFDSRRAALDYLDSVTTTSTTASTTTTTVKRRRPTTTTRAPRRATTTTRP